jgi:hypothetical protein
MRKITEALVAVAVTLGTAVAWAGFTPDVDAALATAEYVYIQTERKSGDLGKAAEIWFYTEDGALYVGTRPTSFRVRRVQAGRTRARVAVGAPDGPAFDATAALVKDAALAGRVMEAFAKKYPEGWKRHETGFREGFESGERVLVKYTPK